MNHAVKCQVIDVTGKLDLPDICQQVQKFVLFKYGYFYYKHQILRTTNKIEEPKKFIVSRWYSVMKLGIDF